MTGGGIEHGPPITRHPTDESALFLPEILLERSAILSGRERGAIPACCILDFDGELIPVARQRFGARRCSAWACFHTEMWSARLEGIAVGLIGGTVGAPFAVLVAEQLIASGCRRIVGYSSSGAISRSLSLPCFVVPERALRDEGTSYHYLPAGKWVCATGMLPEAVARHAPLIGLPVHRGATWTTDAPYRETRSQIIEHRAAGILTVEMEAAALMALAQVRGAEIASLLHVTNDVETGAGGFYKGPADIHSRVITCLARGFADALETSSGCP